MLGNHEGMNLLGLVRDVNPEVYGTFADASSEARRDEAFAALTRCYRTRVELFGEGPEAPIQETRDEWMTRHPFGQIGVSGGAGTGGSGTESGCGRSRPRFVAATPYLFTQGSVLRCRGRTSREINTRVAAELRHFDRFREILAERNLVLPTAAVGEVREIAARIVALAPEAEGKKGRMLRALSKDLEGALGVGGWYLVHKDGPIWYRGASMGSEQENADQIKAILADLKVDRMVVGHTPMRDGKINSRYGGRVLGD